MKVRNMTSSNGNEVPNQFIIIDDDITYFQSYESIIVKIVSGDVYLDSYYWDYSRTTLKYLAQFLRHTTGQAINGKADIQKLINSGEYQLTNLN